MRRGRDGVVAPAELVDADVQRPGRRHGGVLLADGSGRGIARVGVERERGSACFAAIFVLCRDLRVHRVEAGFGHVDLAADLEQRRRTSVQLVGHGVDCPEVGGHVLAGAAVAAGSGLNEASAFVDQRDREPVDLGLGDVGPLLAVEQVGGALSPGEQLLGVERVAQREHAQAVLDHREGPAGWRADGLGRAVFRCQFRECAFKLLEFGEQIVVLGIRNLRRIERVIEMIVAQDFCAQELDSVAGRDHFTVRDG